MFRTLRQRISDMRTIKLICLAAERHANTDGQREPGLEHFVLAALELPDGTARRAFERIGADPDRFAEAIKQQYADALKSIGVESLNVDALAKEQVSVAPVQGPYSAKPQVQALMQRLSVRRPGEPLLGAHVVGEIATVQQGVACRALKTMGVDPDALVDASQREANAHAA